MLGLLCLKCDYCKILLQTAASKFLSEKTDWMGEGDIKIMAEKHKTVYTHLFVVYLTKLSMCLTN